MPFKIIFFALLAFILYSCNSVNKHNIILPNSYTFSKDSSEDVANLDSTSIESYTHKYNADKAIQIPLYRILQHPDYTLYLTIPYHISFKKIIAHMHQLRKQDSMIAINESNQSYYGYYLKDSSYHISFIKQLDSNAVLAIFAETKSLETIGDKLTETNFNNRISK